jgi:hypothetical protein
MRRVKRYELALRELADQGCEHIYDRVGYCVTEGSGFIHSYENGWAGAWCDHCIAYAALHPKEVKHD